MAIMSKVGCFQKGLRPCRTSFRNVLFEQARVVSLAGLCHKISIVKGNSSEIIELSSRFPVSCVGVHLCCFSMQDRQKKRLHKEQRVSLRLSIARCARAIRVCHKMRSVSVRTFEKPYIYGILRKTGHGKDFS